MPRARPTRIPSRDYQKLLAAIYTVMAKLTTPQEVDLFFKELLSPSELLMLARRLRIAQMLIEGETYANIKQELHVGLQTITNVNHWIEQGGRGYRQAIKKIK